MAQSKLRVHSLESFGSVDGPGVRFCVFLQGCPMRCKYCHNPETWEGRGGTEYSAEELLARALRYKSYWGADGGITVSGGEPLLQLDALTEFFRLAKQNGVHTTIDTSGATFRPDDPDYLARFDALLSVTDLVMLDLKLYDREGHRELTGMDNENILALARYLSEHGKPMWIRHVLVPGITDAEEDLTNLAAFIGTLKTVEKIEVLPYHTLGAFKWENLGIPYALPGVKTPTAEEVKRAEAILIK